MAKIETVLVSACLLVLLAGCFTKGSKLSLRAFFVLSKMKGGRLMEKREVNKEKESDSKKKRK
jgi:hypothetical protein